MSMTDMNENVRSALNAETALRGTAPHRVGNLAIRQASASTTAIMQLLGHPLYKVYEAAARNQPAPQFNLSVVDVLLFVWIHAAPEDVVTDTALACSPLDNTRAVKAALKFTSGMSTADLVDAVSAIVADESLRLRAAQFESRPQPLPGEKKTP